MSTSVRFWRWRRNPLRRGSDRIQAWTFLLAILLVTIGAPVVGVVTGRSVAASASRPPAGWHSVAATLTEKAPPPSTPSETNNVNRVEAAVKWHDADGHRHGGFAWVRPNSPAGSRTTVWLDDKGDLRKDFMQPVRTQSRALTLGALAAAGTAVLVVSCYALLRVRLARRRAWQLDLEWSSIA
ncbi:hypothetical protein ACFVYF_29255 [Streptomyces sp. NPDC058274]|uniref:Rv1733c family protein n=1 Tax=Streptomyces sp. NPDC058274 TaxID=3346416 RepID=UPI0036ECDF6D